MSPISAHRRRDVSRVAPLFLLPSYDLEDAHVLFYVYPLKFLWSVVFAPLQAEGRAPDVISVRELPMLFTAYGAGVIATFGILAAMYWHAYSCREQLELTPVEVVKTRVEIYKNVAWAGIGLLSMLVALLLGVLAPSLVGLAGPVYFLIGISEWILGTYEGRQIRQLAVASQWSPT